MMLETYAKNKGVYNNLYEAIYITEYESTLDEGWLYRNNSKEASIYKIMTDKNKEIYAHYHATWYVHEVMQWSFDEFEAYYDDQFKGVYCEDYAEEIEAHLKQILKHSPFCV